MYPVGVGIIAGAVFVLAIAYISQRRECIVQNNKSEIFMHECVGYVRVKFYLVSGECVIYILSKDAFDKFKPNFGNNNGCLRGETFALNVEHVTHYEVLDNEEEE